MFISTLIAIEGVKTTTIVTTDPEPNPLQPGVKGTITTTTITNPPQLKYLDQCVRLVTYGGGGGGGMGSGGSGMGSGGGGMGNGGSGSNGSNVPVAVAATINAAVDVCTYRTYQENTTNTAFTNAATGVLQIGTIGGGVYAAVSGAKDWITALLTGTGAGVTVLQNAQKAAPGLYQFTANNVTQAGHSYYTLLKARASRWYYNGDESHVKKYVSDEWIPQDDHMPTSEKYLN